MSELSNFSVLRILHFINILSIKKYCSKVGSGLYGDLKRRLPHYWSDIKEAVTHMIIAQTFGGLWNGFFGGQPLIVLLSTAPLALYIKIIHTITSSYGVDFFAMYGCVGLFNSLLLMVYSLTGLSRWMRWSTRSTEEIFALFISIAFLVDAAKDCHKKFQVYYVCKFPTNILGSSESITTSQMSVRKIWQSYTSNVSDLVVKSTRSHPEAQLAFGCSRDVALLYLLLLLGTVLFALYLFNFTNTPFLTARKREVLRDFALPISVLTMTLIGSLAFSDIKLQPFSVSSADIKLKTAPFHLLNWSAFAAAFGLAIPLSLLFYMEQNIASAIVNSPANKLRKGPANHWDLLMVSLINLCLSVCCLPWVHVALPHSPLHVKALADTEERVEMGHHIRQTIVRVRETRLTTIFSHLLIGLSLLMIPTPLRFIPPAVLNGLFVYMAITAVYDNQLFERILLFITEQSAYPPSHYIRRVPQRKIHLFTLTQLIQLTALCSVGFAPSAYVELVFPFILVLQIVIRHTIIPRLIDRKYLEALDRCY
ncbi:Sodium bicarbonate transporter protein 11 [Paragonimus heterotremus]|uniref:Sodium bicarbonate transporter protein 11 n=1 Tax=Paragonimus heterotremus TaxID=100268 RepID=A0A8J4TC68_9TREM|nr:Sodium bicarbonate transporter protein 11 [Paragonimus heterotremus]